MYLLEEKSGHYLYKGSPWERFKMYILQIMLVDTLEGWVYQYVTLFGKTGLNEICIEKHFNAF